MFQVFPPKSASFIFLLCLGVSVVGCTSTKRGASSDQSNNPNQLYFDELSFSITGMNAYKVLRQARPEWLRTRGEDSIRDPGEVNVYLEGTEYGSVESLRQIDAEFVDYVEYLSSREAQFRFGPGNTQGVIAIYMKPNWAGPLRPRPTFQEN
jgi:hypothetical protein